MNERAPEPAPSRPSREQLEKANAKLRLHVHYLEQQHARLVAESAALKREVHRAIDELGRLHCERSQFEAELKKSNDYYQSLFESSPTAHLLQDWSEVKIYFDQCRSVGIEDMESHFREHPEVVARLRDMVKIIRVNEAGKKLYRAKAGDDMLGAISLFKPEMGDQDFLRQLTSFARGETLYEGETQNRTMTGDIIHVALRKAVVPGFETTLARVMVSVTDETARERSKRQLQASVREKEILLREIHHRVKNNLQIISGLLDLSAHQAEGKDPTTLLEDARNRVHAMALVHTQLYSSNRFDAIHLERHLRELAHYLALAYGREDRRVRVEVRPSNVELDVNQAIPCALVASELISNAFKHAFGSRKDGTIEVAIEQDGAHRVQVSVHDDGCGLPAHIDLGHPRTLGLQLVTNLVRRQLKGDFVVTRDRGTKATLSFPAARS